MSEAGDPGARSIKVKPYALGLAVLWVLIVCGSLAWNMRQTKAAILGVARVQAQGYRLGDVRGGISVSVPMAAFRAVERSQWATLSALHGLLLLVGLFGIGFGARHVRKRLDSQARAEQEVLRAKQEWERTFDAVPDLIAILDDKHQIVRMNRAMAEKLGKTAEELVGATCYGHVHGTDEPPSECPHTKLLADGQEHAAEVHEERLGGDFLVTATPLRDDDGRVTGCVHVARDITRRKRDDWLKKELNLLNEGLIASGDLSGKLKQITEGVVRIFGADFARIWIARPADLCESGCIHAEHQNAAYVCKVRDMCLHLLASSGRYTHTDGDHRRVPFGAYKIGRIASGEEAVFLTNDVTSDPGVHNHEWAKKLGLRSFAGYRLLSDTGDPIGVLALFSKQTISPSISAQLRGLANTTSQVIQNTLKEEALMAERDKLQAAMERIQVLRGLLPICSSCKKIRDDKGSWNHIETYIHEHSDAEFSHGLCPDCARELYPEIMKLRDAQKKGEAEAEAGTEE